MMGARDESRGPNFGLSFAALVEFLYSMKNTVGC
jgi:hypothetical protein